MKNNIDNQVEFSKSTMEMSKNTSLVRLSFDSRKEKIQALEEDNNNKHEEKEE